VNFLAWADAGQAVADGTNEYDYYDVSLKYFHQRPSINSSTR